MSREIAFLWKICFVDLFFFTFVKTGYLNIPIVQVRIMAKDRAKSADSLKACWKSRVFNCYHGNLQYLFYITEILKNARFKQQRQIYKSAFTKSISLTFVQMPKVETMQTHIYWDWSNSIKLCNNWSFPSMWTSIEKTLRSNGKT